MANYDLLFPLDDSLHLQNARDPFRIPEFWRPSSLTVNPSENTALFKNPFLIREPETKKKKLEHTSTFFSLPPDLQNSKQQSDRLQLPRLPLEDFDFDDDGNGDDPLSDSLAEDDGNVFSSVLGDGDEDGLGIDSEEGLWKGDLWLDPDTSVPPEAPRIYTWDSFLVEGANEPANGYISEADSRILDVALDDFESTHGIGKDMVGSTIVQAEVFCMCLLHLGLGRSSVLFMYDRKAKEFRPVREKLRVSGCTLGTISNIVKTFANCGKNIKKLERFSDRVYQDSGSSSQSLVSLARCTNNIVESVRKRLSTTHLSVRSILHLHSLIREPALIVDSFVQLTAANIGAKDDACFLSRLFDIVQQQQHRSGWLRPLLVETLARVSRPWLEFVEQWIGLNRGPGGVMIAELIRKGQFVQVEEVSELDEAGKERKIKNYSFDKTKVPSFISPDTAETIFECGRSLRFLETFHPCHPLSMPGSSRSINSATLHWKFSWQDLEDLQTQAKTYENGLRVAIRRYTMRKHEEQDLSYVKLASGLMDIDIQLSEPLQPYGKTKEEIIEYLIESSKAMSRDLPTVEETARDDSLVAMVLHLTRSDITLPDSHLITFAPPLSITPLLSFSNMISSQSRLINKSCLQMFFKEHNILDHLVLLRHFHLFGDGIFSTRLAHALFDADLDTTERQEGVTRTGGAMGLKLGSRETWPPASSELRLALMDVLTESFSASVGIHSAGKTGELPGGLSFSVREMSEQELDNCMDPNSIEALDFLRLDYKPPHPLDAVITPLAMHGYDRIFRLLLRVRRLVFVVNTFFYDVFGRRQCRGGVRQSRAFSVALKFSIEARHFITTVAAYMLESGIGTTWNTLESEIRDIEAKIDNEDVEFFGSVDLLRTIHERTLDRILFALLLRKRQSSFMAILDEIFEGVLRFARICRVHSASCSGKEEEVDVMYRTFRRCVSVFMSVCRGLGEKRGCKKTGATAAGSTGNGEADLLGGLLLRLEMSGYYSSVP